jgi:hypothetical protein
MGWLVQAASCHANFVEQVVCLSDGSRRTDVATCSVAAKDMNGRVLQLGQSSVLGRFVYAVVDQDGGCWFVTILHLFVPWLMLTA